MTTLLNIILVVVVAEAAFLVALRLRSDKASEIPSDLAYLGAGFFLILAVRVAWSETSPVLPVLALLTLGGASHIVDVIRRFRKPSDAAEQLRAP